MPESNQGVTTKLIVCFPQSSTPSFPANGSQLFRHIVSHERQAVKQALRQLQKWKDEDIYIGKGDILDYRRLKTGPLGSENP